RIDGRSRPVFGLDVGGVADLAQWIQTSADQRDNARVVQIVPKDLIKYRGTAGGFDIGSGRLKLGKRDLDDRCADVRSGCDLPGLHGGSAQNSCQKNK